MENTANKFRGKEAEMWEKLYGYYDKAKVPPLFLLENSERTFFFPISEGEFRTAMENTDYKDKIYLTASETWDVGTKSEFDSKIEDAIKHGQERTKEKESLIKEREAKKDKRWECESAVMSGSKISEIIIWLSLILLALLYPIRGCILVILWAVKTVKA